MLDVKTAELVAIGAAVMANCRPCLDHHAQEARKAGVSNQEMAEAAAIARMVRKAVMEKMDEYTGEKLGERAPECKPPSPCCSK